MKRKSQSYILIGMVVLLVFLAYTASLTAVDRHPIGPNGSVVAYATVNRAVHDFFGVHLWLYHLTDWAGVVAIAVAFGFAVVGLVQWIQRRNIWRVDRSILLLGAFYLLVFGVYVFFEYTVINYRPVLIYGFLEASYPSSTTMLAACVLPTAMMQFKRLIRNRMVCRIVNGLCGVFTVFMVVGRLVCGVHWFTDIVGGLLFSTAMVCLYYGAETAV